MTTSRRVFLAASALAALPLTMRGAVAASAKKADFLFVQTARAMTFDKAANKLTLEGVSPITVMFADRPERIASHMRTAGEMPAKGWDVSVFIDIIGMPLTPLSFAGVRRRAWLRAVYN